MQNGSITRSKRLKGPDVWEFRWRESGPDGKRKHRRMVVGSIRQFADESAALRTITALRRDINLGNARLRAKPITVSELVDHYRQRELEPDTASLRFAQGYSASMLVEESRIFQVTTFGTLQLHQSELDQNQVLLDVIIIADEADRQLTETVRSFMTARAAVA